MSKTRSRPKRTMEYVPPKSLKKKTRKSKPKCIELYGRIVQDGDNINPKGIISSKENINYYFFPNNVEFNHDLIKSKPLVCFFKTGNSLNVSRVRLLKQVDDLKVLEKWFQNDNFHDSADWKETAAEYFNRQSDKGELKVQIRKKLSTLPEPHLELFFSTLPSGLFSALDILDIFESRHFNPAHEIDILQKVRPLHIVEDRIVKCVHKVDIQTKNRFWKTIPHSQAVDCEKLFQIAPYEAKCRIIDCKYKIYNDLTKAFTVNIYPRIGFSTPASYVNIDDQDLQLTALWQQDKSDNHEYNRMLSARLAERVAITFYRNVGFNTEDISIHQLNSLSEDWKTHDILLDGTIPVDVKNARTPVNNKHCYVEHCVPRLKENREKKFVLITGVISPYCRFDKGHYHDMEDIRVLGETDQKSIEKIQQQYSSNIFEIKILSSRVNYPPNSRRTNNTIPPWVFDYPGVFYSSYDKLATSICRLDASKIPSQNHARKFDLVNSIPFFIYKNKLPPSHTMDGLQPWQIELIESIVSNEKLTLPILFMELLTHFIKMASNPVDTGYSPEKYRDLFFHSKKVNNIQRHPLGIYDPLNTTDNLCTSLEILWNSDYKDRLKEYHSFRFHGLGVLRGKPNSSDKYETILAYCGGYIRDYGKCGHSPLIIGHNDICPLCRKLICNKCSWCSGTRQHPCRSYEERKSN